MNRSPALVSFAPVVRRSNSLAPSAASERGDAAADRRVVELEPLGGGDELPGARDSEEDPDVVPVHGERPNMQAE